MTMRKAAVAFFCHTPERKTTLSLVGVCNRFTPRALKQDESAIDIKASL
jgi:hypothetical protein